MRLKKRFARKLEGYAAYRREERHVEKYGIQKFRVPTLTT